MKRGRGGPLEEPAPWMDYFCTVLPGDHKAEGFKFRP